MVPSTAAGPKFYIGLAGLMGSGKGEVVNILQRHGFAAISLSDIVRQHAAELDQPVSRQELQDIGNRLRRQGGAAVLARLVREQIENSSQERWVIDGIRNPAEVAELRLLRGFVLIGIETSVATILERLRRRNRVTDRAEEAELRRRLERELGEDEPEDGQRVGDCLLLADIRLENDSSLEELARRIEVILCRLGASHD